MRLWKWWVSLLGQQEGGEALALTRICAGACLVYSVVTVMLNGLIGVMWSDASFGGLRTPEPPVLIQLLGGARPEVIWGIAGLCCLAGIAVTFGFFTRSAMLVGLVSFNTLIRVNPHDGSAYDSLLTNLLFILMFSGCGTTWSIDCRRRIKRWSSVHAVACWPRYVLIFQILLCYWATGVQKISGHWLPFGDLAALFHILQDPFWQRFDMRWTSEFYWMTQIGTLTTWLWEVGAGAMLLAYYFRSTRERSGKVRWLFNRFDFRTLYALTGVLFHVIILVTMRVGPFSFIALSYYPLFWTSQEWRSGLRFIQRKVCGDSSTSRPRPLDGDLDHAPEQRANPKAG
jgi:hypothetical protein